MRGLPTTARPSPVPARSVAEDAASSRGIAMPPRARFNGAESKLERLIKEHATSPVWLRYEEDISAPIDRGNMTLAKDFLIGLLALQSNLAFKKSTLERVLARVVRKAQWKLRDKAEEQDWVTTLGKRIMVLCHQAQRSKPNKWFKRLRAQGDDDEEDSPDGENDVPSGPSLGCVPSWT